MQKIDLIGVLTPSMVEQIKNICRNPTDLEFQINSEGGITRRCNAILGMTQYLKDRQFNVNGLVIGDAHSAAFIILQTCTSRKALPTANLMFHAPAILRFGRGGEPPFVDDRNPNHPMHRSFLEELAKRTKLPIETLEQWGNEERHFTAQEALEFNFIDQITDPTATS